jgi:hypothetical protein
VACLEEPEINPREYKRIEVLAGHDRPLKYTKKEGSEIIEEPKIFSLDPGHYAKAYYRRHREKILEKSRRRRRENTG